MLESSGKEPDNATEKIHGGADHWGVLKQAKTGVKTADLFVKQPIYQLNDAKTIVGHGFLSCSTADAFGKTQRFRDPCAFRLPSNMTQLLVGFEVWISAQDKIRHTAGALTILIPQIEINVCFGNTFEITRRSDRVQFLKCGA